MGKIATEQEAYNIGKKGTPQSNKCCTKSRALDLGCQVKGNYSSSQLVQFSDLSKSSFIVVSPTNLSYYSGQQAKFTLIVKSSSDWSLNVLVYTKPVKGSIIPNKKQGSMGESTLTVRVTGAKVSNPSGITEYYCGGSITFTNAEGDTARANVDLSYVQDT